MGDQAGKDLTKTEDIDLVIEHCRKVITKKRNQDPNAKKRGAPGEKDFVAIHNYIKKTANLKVE